MKRIVYISYDGMTDPLGQSQVIPYIKGLSQLGYQFSLISFEKQENFASGKSTISTLLSESNIIWHPLLYTKKPPVLSTLYDIYKLKKLVRTLHQQNPFDLIHCRSYISALAGLSMSEKHGVPFVFDMRGFWADERVDGGLWDLKNPIYHAIYKFFKKKETEFVKASSAVISLTHKAKAEILTWDSISPDKFIKVIPCCVDTDLFNPEHITEQALDKLRTRLHLDKSAPVIVYLGALNTWYCLPEMLQFFKLFLQKHPKTKIVFVTHEPETTIWKEAEKQKIDPSFIIIRKAARTEVPLYLSLATFSVFFIKQAYSKMASSPTKLGELLSMNIPVICNAGVGDTEGFVKQLEAGIVVENFSREELLRAATTIDISTQVDLRNKANELFSLQIGVQSYSEVYDEIFRK